MAAPAAGTSGLDRLLHGGSGTMSATALEPIPGRRLLRGSGSHVYAVPRVDHPATGEPLTLFSDGGGATFAVVRDANGVVRAPFDLEDAYTAYVTEAWTGASANRRLSHGQLAAFYRAKRLVPRRAQLRLRRALIRWQGEPTFPTWPLDDGVGELLRLHAAIRMSERGTTELEFPWFWPAPYHAALILTHDVEGPAGIRLAVELADLEESLGFRSAFNFGAWYDIDPGVLRELESRGFEIGMHGLVHDRSLFSSRAEFERQTPLLRELAERLGAVGFRSPATHRVIPWLAELPVEYDCTVPHSDPYEPQPGGCCSLWPFFVGDVVELPYTLPQDHTLLTLLGNRTAELWLETARRIEDRFGLIQCVTHPDPGYLGDHGKRGIYAEFLRGVAERTAVWRARPRDVAAWWRSRAEGSARPTGVGTVSMSGASARAEILPP